MNAQAAIAKSASQPAGVTARAAPAASLAGLRLWKDEDAAVPASSAALAPAPLVPALQATPTQATVPPAEHNLDALTDASGDEAESAPMAVTIAEGGLPKHVSPYPQRARDESRRDSDILGYWARIRGDRDMPAWRDLDQNQIAFFWPNSFLMACISRGERGRPMISRATRVVDDDGMADRSADIPFTAAMVSWIVRVSLDVASIGSPLDDSRTFLTESGEPLAFDLIALPLSETGARVDAVLCHLKRS